MTTIKINVDASLSNLHWAIHLRIRPFACPVDPEDGTGELS